MCNSLEANKILEEIKLITKAALALKLNKLWVNTGTKYITEEKKSWIESISILMFIEQTQLD